MRARLLFPAVAALTFAVPAAAQMDGDFSAGGAIRIGASTTTCDSSAKGGLRWNDTDLTVEMCDGASWRKIVAQSGAGDPSTPDPNTGYFVLTSGSWNGDLGTAAGGGLTGLTAANKLCLDDLTANNWMGKTDAQTRGLLVLSKVKAFLCVSANCNQANASQEYTFAVSGDATKGGASFTADASTQGPNNTQGWSGTNYFGAASYWTGRSAASSSLWSINPSGNHCTNWSSSVVVGNYGDSSNTGAGRYAHGQANCNVAYKLVCFVHP